MKTIHVILVAAISCFASAWSCFADSVGEPFPFVTSSQNGSYFFKMIPGKPPGLYANHTEQEPFGVAYKVEDDGSFTELWRVDGWYCGVHLSNDGKHLVRMGPWNGGSYDKDLALAIYENGELLNKYTVSDLVEDESKITHSISHYEWRDWETDFGRERGFDQYDVFRLMTCDGIVYTFSVKLGGIILQKKQVSKSPIDK